MYDVHEDVGHSCTCVRKIGRIVRSFMRCAPRRKHEISVRLALGADHGGVLRLVVSEGAVLIVLGVLIGAPATYFAGRAVSGVLVGVSPSDPITLSSVSVGLAAVALAACHLPRDGCSGSSLLGRCGRSERQLRR